jgi:hypothetical protein
VFVRRLLRGAALGGLGLTIWACSTRAESGSTSPEPEFDAGDEAGGAGPTDAGGPYHMPPDTGMPTEDAEAQLDRVDLGVLALPLATSSAGSIAPAAPIETHLAVASAGARAFALGARWDELMDGDGMLVPETWEALDQALAIYAPEDTTLLFSLNVVDGESSARPEGLGEWEDPEIPAAAARVIDELFARFPERVKYLQIGHAVDRYLYSVKQSERSRFLVFALSLFEYARQHQQRPNGLGLGAGASFEGLTRESLPELMALIASSDVVMSDYLPLNEKHEARPTDEVAADLDALAALTQDGPEHVVLTEVAYPSAEVAGSSVQQQQRFFDDFFDALATRRSTFPFVAVSLWSDPSPGYCSSAATAAGAANSATLLEAYCSLGLRALDDSSTPNQAIDKPALTRVLDALATFHTP